MSGASPPLALVQLVAIPFAVWLSIMIAIACRLLIAGAIIFLQPWIDALSKRTPGFVGRFIRWAAGPVVNTLKNWYHGFLAYLTKSFNGAAAPLVLMLNQQAALIEETYRTLGDLSLETWRTIDTLTRTTIPREIGKGLNGVKGTLQNHTTRLNTLESLNQQVAVIVGNGLRALPWGVAGSYVGNIDRWWDSYKHLWNQTFNFIAPKLGELTGVTVPALERAVTRLTARVDALSEAGLEALTARIVQLETWRENVVMPRLEALREADELLTEMVLGLANVSLADLFERVGALETQLEQRIATLTESFEERVAALELELEELLGTATATLLERVQTLEQQIADFVGTATATLAQRVTEIEAQLEAFVGTQTAALAERVTALETALETRIRLELDGLLGRIETLEQSIATVIVPAINRLEAILEPAAFAALVLATMRTVAPNLFCRNVTETSKRICSADPGLIDDVLAFAFPLLALADICALAHLIRSAADAFEPVLRGVLAGLSAVADCSSIEPAPDLALRAAALPTPTAAIAL